MMGQSLFRSYGRCFAEFLSESSLVGLRLLASSTGVGLRYGRQQHKFRRFSSQELYFERYIPIIKQSRTPVHAKQLLPVQEY